MRTRNKTESDHTNTTYVVRGERLGWKDILALNDARAVAITTAVKARKITDLDELLRIWNAVTVRWLAESYEQGDGNGL